MATSLVGGQLDWRMSRDDEGHREYKIRWQVKASSSDGPYNVLLTPGLPLPGSTWNFDNDVDSAAICRPGLSITPRVSSEPNEYWTVEQTFSTKPLNHCASGSIDNPLLQPMKIGGTFNRETLELYLDRHGNPLISSSHEFYDSSVREVPVPLPVVSITKNVLTLPLAQITNTLIFNPLNDSTLWGVAARGIRFSNASWDRRWYGTCIPYYELTYEFEVGFFDRWVVDKGTKVLAKGGNKENPKHYVQYRSEVDNTPGEVLLDGNGKELAVGIPPHEKKLELLGQSNLLLLGIPSSL